MSAIRNYRDLLVWQKSMEQCAIVYRLIEPLPKHEEFGLKAQIRRAATSIPFNIGEGHGRDHLGDCLRHLSIAKGSLAELETQILLAAKLNCLSQAAIAEPLRAADEISRMLNGLSAKLRSSLKPDT
jgi:four helix bundle protein